MQQKRPKDTATLRWTKHAAEKMRLYGLSEARVLRVIENPERREEGIAENTVACMQTVGNKRKTEIWILYQIKKKSGVNGQMSNVIISVWRYPGQTKSRDPVPIPEDARHELE